MTILNLLASADTGGTGNVNGPASKGLYETNFTNPILGPNLQNLTGLQFFQKLLPAVIGLGFVVGFLIFVFIFILGAIQWISSGGDKAAVDAARGKISNAIIGLVVLLSVIAIIKLIENFFGINILTIDIGPLKIQ